MSCSVVAEWGKTGMAEVRICVPGGLKKCEIFRKTSKIYDGSKSVMEKGSKTGIR